MLVVVVGIHIVEVGGLLEEIDKDNINANQNKAMLSCDGFNEILIFAHGNYLGI